MLAVKEVSFSYDDGPLLQNISFALDPGHHMTVIGASGCGKSTLLKLIYGLYQPEQGKIFWQQRELPGPAEKLIPGEPFIKFVSQDFDLFPFHTVAENVGKHLQGIPDEDKERRIDKLLEMVELKAYAQKQAKYLSGGQKQRVALVRALAEEPELLLLDEPFSHIDHFRKNDLRRSLFNYLKQKKITCIVATHDYTEVLSFSDQTLVMKEGRVVDQGTPDFLYNHPKSKYIATLFGEVNEIPLQVFSPEEDAGVTVLLYPHELKRVEKSALQVKVSRSYFKGSRYLIETSFQGQPLFFENDDALIKGSFVYLTVSSHLLNTRKMPADRV